MNDLHGNDGTQVAEGTMPTCPSWCVECWDLSKDLPGSRYHHSAPTPPIPALLDMTGTDDYVMVRTCFFDVSPALRRTDVSDEYNTRVEVCLGSPDMAASLLPADARQLALAILQEVDLAEGTLDTREQSPSS